MTQDSHDEKRRKHMAVMDDKRKIEELEAKLAKAVTALRFYADVSNYDEGIVGTTHEAPMWSESDFTEFEWDNGDKARIALAEIKGE
jgi:hypothetical protein